MASEVFDHTSTLRFLEARFGAEVPNLSAWRRSVTGDMTSAFNFAAPNSSLPSLPQPSAADSRVVNADCAVGGGYDELNPPSTTLGALENKVVPPYPITVNTRRPRQESGKARTPSGVMCAAPRHPASLHARGVHAVTSGEFKGTIATFSYSDRKTHASAFTATIHWGDGHVSHGRISGRRGHFHVQGDQRYPHHDRRYGVRVRITSKSGQRATAHSEITVATPVFTG